MHKTSKSAVFLFILTAAAVSGCANILEGSVEHISPHESTPYERPPVELITIDDFDEFREYLYELIYAYEESTTVQYPGIGEDVQNEISRICEEALRGDPVVAYAVAGITASAVRVVSYYEINIEIEFKKTAEQLQSIISASTRRYMITQLLEKMRQYQDEAVFLTNLQLDREEIISQITELYYQNPGRLIMLPFVTVDVYPQTGPHSEENGQADGQADTYRVYEIKIGYTEDTEMLRAMSENLDYSVRRNAARAGGDTDGEILLSLAQNLTAGTVYDEGIAATIAMHGQQNIAATAFGALYQGNAVGEGFAMAYKALCDELRLDCRVVLGFLEEKYHAWNIVLLDGYYYHIDTAMCALTGLEAGFLKTDEDFAEMLYTWDTGAAPRCNGTMTLEDLLPPEEPDDPDDLNGGGDGGSDNGDDDDGDDGSGIANDDGNGDNGEE